MRGHRQGTGLQRWPGINRILVRAALLHRGSRVRAAEIIAFQPHLREIAVMGVGSVPGAVRCAMPVPNPDGQRLPKLIRVI